MWLLRRGWSQQAVNRRAILGNICLLIYCIPISWWLQVLSTHSFRITISSSRWAQYEMWSQNHISLPLRFNSTKCSKALSPCILSLSHVSLQSQKQFESRSNISPLVSIYYFRLAFYWPWWHRRDLHGRKTPKWNKYIWDLQTDSKVWLCTWKGTKESNTSFWSWVDFPSVCTQPYWSSSYKTVAYRTFSQSKIFTRTFLRLSFVMCWSGWVWLIRFGSQFWTSYQEWLSQSGKEV